MHAENSFIIREQPLPSICLCFAWIPLRCSHPILKRIIAIVYRVLLYPEPINELSQRYRPVFLHDRSISIVQSELTTVSKTKSNLSCRLSSRVLIFISCYFRENSFWKYRTTAEKVSIRSFTNYRHTEDFQQQYRNPYVLFDQRRNLRKPEKSISSRRVRESLFQDAAFCREDEQLLLSASEFHEKYIGTEMEPAVLSARDFTKRRRKCRWSSILLRQVDF